MQFARFIIPIATIATVLTVALGASAAASPRSPREATASGYGEVVFRIKIPRAAPAPNVHGVQRLRPRYVSVATQSFAILTDGQHPVVGNVNPTQGFAYVFVLAPAGMHTFTVTAYDRLGAIGNVLSTGTTAPVSVPATGTITLRLTLDGVVSQVALALAQPQVTIGNPALINLDVVAKDADGNTILDGTLLTQPFTVKSSDPVNAKLSQTVFRNSLAGYSSSQRVSVAYSGANVSPITFTAGGTGLSLVTPAVLTALPPPASGGQVVVTGGPDPNAAFSTLSGNQFLGSIGVPPSDYPWLRLDGNVYGSLAVDALAKRLYIVFSGSPNEGASFPTPPILIYNARGGHALVDSFEPGVNVDSMAIDSAGRKLYASSRQNADILIFGTASGHPLIGKIPSTLEQPELTVDPAAHRLYATGCVTYFCAPGAAGLEVFSTDPPYTIVGSLINSADHGYFGKAAVDSARGRFYVFESSNASIYGTIGIYDAATLNRLGSFGPWVFPQEMAFDAAERRLYVLLLGAETAWPYGGVVLIYDIDSGPSLIGSFNVTLAARYIDVAPYAP